MENRHATPLALAAFGFLAACGGGDKATEGGTVPETVPESALFTAETASRLQALTKAGPPVEITEEEAERREEQDRIGGQSATLFRGDPTDERYDSLDELAYEHWEDAWTGGKWHGILAKDGLSLQGNRAGSNRALLVDMDHFEFYIFTTDAMGGGNSSGAWGVPSGSAPNERATWQGLMIGAATNDGRDLLQGDAMISFNFDDMTVDASFTDIVNLDRMAAHSVPRVMFPGIHVSDNGIWERGDDGSERYIIGGFAGSGHEEAGGRFSTDDMTGSFGAARQ